jgi:hypothetical protein
MLQCNGFHWWLRHGHHHTRLLLLHVVLSTCSPPPLQVLSAPWGRRADSGGSCILVGSCPIEAWSSSHLGLGLLVGLRCTSAYHTVRPDPSTGRSWTQERVYYVACPRACTWRQWHLDRTWWPMSDLVPCLGRSEMTALLRTEGTPISWHRHLSKMDSNGTT